MADGTCENGNDKRTHVPQITDLLPTLALSVSSFILAVLILVTVHELGHYLVGRWRGIGAEVFSVGFGPELFAVTDRRGTRWRLALIPLGGYVKFRGDASVASAPSGEGGEGGFEAASLLSRALTVAAGPAVNLLFAVLLIAGAAWWSGVAEEEPRIGALRPFPAPTGLETGDLVLSVADRGVSGVVDLIELSESLPPGAPLPWTVERDGERLIVPGPRPLPPLIERVNPLSPAARAGLAPGDVILELDGEPVSDFSELREAVLGSDGAPVLLRVWRDGDRFEVRITPERTDQPLPGGRFETRWVLGVGAGPAFEPALRTPGVLEALTIGAERTWEVVVLNGSALAHLVTGAISPCNVRGVITMGEVSGASAAQGAGSFVMFLALLSVVIGFMNLLPIPTLDGGHLALYAWEGVTGRAPSPRVMSAMMTVGMVLLIGFMALGLLNDLTC